VSRPLRDARHRGLEERRRGSTLEAAQADDLIERLGLSPHPEGGWYRRSFVSAGPPGRRPSGSAIYYLLRRGEVSRRHRIDATELWHHYAGGPLVLELSDGGAAAERVVLGTDLSAGERPQVRVPAGWWQSAWPLAGAVLVGCTVSPAFQFSAFELDDERGE
jgi:predicted cupin superfamily sugar epimerase